MTASAVSAPAATATACCTMPGCDRTAFRPTPQQARDWAARHWQAHGHRSRIVTVTAETYPPETR
jgi:hypothetical protein